MQSNIVINRLKKNNAKSNFLDCAGLLMEMEMLGVDPAPFLEVAARDLINQFGRTALKYSIQIEQNFIETGDIDSAAIWSRISSQLSKLQKSERRIDQQYQ